LRERADDIPQIVDFCLQNLVKQRKARVSKVSPEAMALLVRHRWPGNVRELENVIYRSAVIAQGDAILVKDLPVEIGGGSSAAVPGPEVAPAPVPADAAEVPPEDPAQRLTAAFNTIFSELKGDGVEMLARTERELLQRWLAAHGGDPVAAAKPLGLTKVQLQKKVKEV
jgi:two-component system nitrogen regulation response regulator GlnG